MDVAFGPFILCFQCPDVFQQKSRFFFSKCVCPLCVSAEVVLCGCRAAWRRVCGASKLNHAAFSFALRGSVRVLGSPGSVDLPPVGSCSFVQSRCGRCPPHTPPPNPLHPPTHTHTHSLTIRKEALEGRRFIVALEQPSEQSSLFLPSRLLFPQQTTRLLFSSSSLSSSSSLVDKYASFSRNTTHQICDKLSRPHFLLFLSS